jgi:outer membrane protein assembly factor BamB
MHLFLLALVPVLPAAGSPSSNAREDWPQWGGPARTGVSHETGWSVDGKAEPLWTAQVGLGYSSVAVANGRLYTLGYDKDLELDVVRCLDALTGAEVWAHAYPSKIWDLYHKGGTLTTPTVAGDVVYVAEREGLVHCLDAESGEVRWEKQLAKEHGLDVPQWGFSASPVVHGDALVLNYGKVIALDKRTGAPVWTTPKSYGDAYSTPIELDYKGTPALAVFTGSGLALLRAADGGELALTPWKTKYDVNAMTPIVLGQRVFISSGYDRGCALVDLSGAEPKIVWESKEMRNQMSGSVHWEGHLYGFDDKVLKCIDLAGEEQWRERGLGQGALSIAGGRLIVMSEDGELLIAPAKPDGFEELARKKVFDGGICWTVPVLANGIVYARNQAGELAALDHRPR